MVDSTKMLSQQTLVRAGTSNNPLGLYNYEHYSAVVPWFMVGWVSPINGNISIVKVNNICTLTLNIFNNPNTGVVSIREILSNTYRLPKRFRPKNSDGLVHYSFIGCSAGSGAILGSLEIYNNSSNENDPLNGRLLIGEQNATNNGFTNLSARVLTSSVSFETQSILND